MQSEYDIETLVQHCIFDVKNYDKSCIASGPHHFDRSSTYLPEFQMKKKGAFLSRRRRMAPKYWYKSSQVNQLIQKSFENQFNVAVL